MFFFILLAISCTACFHRWKSLFCYPDDAQAIEMDMWAHEDCLSKQLDHIRHLTLRSTYLSDSNYHLINRGLSQCYELIEPWLHTQSVIDNFRMSQFDRFKLRQRLNVQWIIQKCTKLLIEELADHDTSVERDIYAFCIQGRFIPPSFAVATESQLYNYYD